MLLSKLTYVKIAPNNYVYWKNLGYDVGHTGGRGGLNTKGRIKVKVSELLAGSNVYVSCRCNRCAAKFLQRFCRDRDLCSSCKLKGRMTGNAHSKKHDVPDEARLRKILQENNIAQAIKILGVTRPVLDRWLKAYNIKRSKTPLPLDFLEWYNEYKPSKNEIEKKYSVSRPVVNRWIRENSLAFRGKTSKIKMPSSEDLSRLNQTHDTDGLALIYNVSAQTIRDWFRRHHIDLKNHGSKGTSNEESIFCSFLDELVPGWIRNKKSILSNNMLELDAYHPKLAIAFEYDGIYHHSGDSFRKKHRHKMNLCEEKGITLYRINSIEWTMQNHICRSMIRSKLNKIENIYHARKLRVAKVSRETAHQFHESNHISGFGNSSVNFGLYAGSTLVSLMSFSKSRYVPIIPDEWEISRFSSLVDTTIVGAAGKLFAAFVKDQAPRRVISFVDLRWGRGRVYEAIGFKKISRGDPTYWYYRQDTPTRFSRVAFSKNKLRDKLQLFDPALSETENMEINKYFKYWDHGSDKYVWNAA